MASSRDIEGAVTPSERSPLLAPRPSEDGGSLPDEPKVGSRKWRYAWRGFWVVFVTLIVAVFIKGWIDADDVDVSH